MISLVLMDSTLESVTSSVNASLVDYKHNIMAFENHSIHNIRYVCTKFKKQNNRAQCGLIV